MAENTGKATARGTVRVDSYCACGNRWSIEGAGSVEVSDLDYFLWRNHGSPDERHHGVTPDECRRERNRRAGQAA